MVATESTDTKEGGRPKAKTAIPVELLIVTITTNYPGKGNQEDSNRLYKWVGLDSLTTAVHMLRGWPLLVSNFTPAVSYLHAVFAVRHSRVIENIRAGMAPGEIIRALLGTGLNLKGVLYFILL